jgi:hypothetical protein
MKLRPISLSKFDVLAILAGRKNQIRVPGKFQNDKYTGLGVDYFGDQLHRDVATATYRARPGRDSARYGICDSPFGVPGHGLWVRERHWMDVRDSSLVVMDADGAVIAKNGSNLGEFINVDNLRKNKFWELRYPSTMPRWASRLTLAITLLRAERLNSISAADAISEGIEGVVDNSPYGAACGWTDYLDAGSLPFDHDKPQASYQSLWESIHGKKSWKSNPWVWAINFDRVAPVPVS